MPENIPSIVEFLEKHGQTSYAKLIDALPEESNENIDALQRSLAQEIQDGNIVRVYNNGLQYRIASSDDNFGGDDIDGLEVVNKELNPYEYVSWDAFDFFDVNGGYNKMKAKVESAINGGGAAPRISLVGETGTGKTAAVNALSKEYEFPVFRVQGRYAVNEAHLLGRSVLINDTTKFMYGPVAQAVRMSRERPTALFVDEMNRIRSDGRSIFMSLQRDNATVTIDQRGGEKIVGNPNNLMVFGTKNEGAAYETKDTDIAERRRFTEIEFTYLGMEHPDKEAQILVDRTPVGPNLAEAMVQIANEIRDGVQNNYFNHVNMGVPTAVLLDWAQTAYDYTTYNIGNPVYEAALDEVVRPVYGRRETTQTEIESAISEMLNGAPFDDEEFGSWATTENFNIQ